MTEDGRVQCNYCEADRGVKTYTCPFRFCEQVAMCGSCALLHPEHRSKVGHRSKGCEAGASSTRASQAERRKLTNDGHYLLTAAARAGEGVYHAIFKSGESKLGRFIPVHVYERTLGVAAATLEDCTTWAGTELPEAPPDFDGEGFGQMLASALVKFNQGTSFQPPASKGTHLPQATLF
jgi:hypothetical protein